MVQQIITIGAPGAGFGDKANIWAGKDNANFTELYAAVAALSGSSGLSMVNAKVGFGATGDNTTDDWAAIQAAIDYAIDNSIYTVYLPEGRYKISKTLQLGYGTSSYQFTSIRLLGAGNADTAVPDRPFTHIIPTFVDKPVINIQGARYTVIEDLCIKGSVPIGNFMDAALSSKSNPANYVPAGAQDNSKTPFCGICIDGYSGTIPASLPYPTPTYPSFVGSGGANQYGKAFSSGIFIRNVQILDTLIGVMCQPNSSSNGDFLKIQDCAINNQKVAVAWGNAQARSNDMVNINCNNVYCAFSGTRYGQAIGQMNGHWDNLHINGCYRIFELAEGWTAPFTVNNLFGELTTLLGDHPGKISGGIMDFKQARTSAGAFIEERREPISVGQGIFENFKLSYRSGLFLFTDSTQFINCVTGSDAGAPAPTGSLALALDAIDNYFYIWDHNGGDAFPRAFINQMNSEMGGNNNIWSRGQRNGWIEYEMPVIAQFHNVQSWSSPSLGTQGTPAGATLNVTTDSYVEPGDLFISQNANTTGHIFYCDSIVGTAAVLKALCGYTFDGTNYSMINATLDPNWVYVPRGVLDFADDQNIYFSTTVGSPTLNLVNSLNAAVSVPAGVTTKSKPLWYAKDVTLLRERIPFPSKTRISSIGATSLTMTANALVTGIWLYGPGIKRLA